MIVINVGTDQASGWRVAAIFNKQDVTHAGQTRVAVTVASEALWERRCAGCYGARSILVRLLPLIMTSVVAI